MCGIFGYIGNRNTKNVLLDGLKALEYRGYDSAGAAILDPNQNLKVCKVVGRVNDLSFFELSDLSGSGIGHTRWATHGEVNEQNAHPHLDCLGQIAVVHNGIIDNYQELRSELIKEGHDFKTNTDTEVIAHLLERSSIYSLSLQYVLGFVCKELKGHFAFAVISTRHPDAIFAVRKGSPLVIGIGNAEYFVSSDIPSILRFTDDFLILEDGSIAKISSEGVLVTGFDGNPRAAKSKKVFRHPVLEEKGGFKHSMLKEIFEQPRALRDTLRSGLAVSDGITQITSLNSVTIDPSYFALITDIRILACGTSYHAGLVGRHFFENMTGLPTMIYYSSEFLYDFLTCTPASLIVAISQSGETLETVLAANRARDNGSYVIAISNVEESSLAEESDGLMLTVSGHEKSVASTKTFTAQLANLFLLSRLVGESKWPEEKKFFPILNKLILDELITLPAKIEQILSDNSASYDNIWRLAERWYRYNNFLYLGRGINYPVAMEGALKLKEISYIHAEAYPAGEMKHGPLALIDDTMSVLVVNTYDCNNTASTLSHNRTISNIEEIKTRGGKVIALLTEGDESLIGKVDDLIYVPKTDFLLMPFLSVVSLQLLAYFIAVKRGCDIDHPRNLAKCVTVE